jgi:hypothetical protein
MYTEHAPGDGLKERIVRFVMAVANLVHRYKRAKDVEYTEEIDSMLEVNPMV